MQSTRNLSPQGSGFKAPQDRQAVETGPATASPGVMPGTVLPRWRGLRAALKTAWDVSAYAGPRPAARAIAYELSGTDWATRRDTLRLLASQAAKGHFGLPRVADVLDELDRMPRREIGPVVRRRRHPIERRAPLPVEAARSVPLDVVFGRLGIEVRRRGREVKARCPFHDDRHPSLELDLRKSVWFCHVCQVGGDGIELVMRKKGLAFADAVREVAA